MHFDFKDRKKLIIDECIDNNILLSGGLKVKGYENYTRVSIGPLTKMEPFLNIAGLSDQL